MASIEKQPKLPREILSDLKKKGGPDSVFGALSAIVERADNPFAEETGSVLREQAGVEAFQGRVMKAAGHGEQFARKAQEASIAKGDQSVFNPTRYLNLAKEKYYNFRSFKWEKKQIKASSEIVERLKTAKDKEHYAVALRDMYISQGIEPDQAEMLTRSSVNSWARLEKGSWERHKNRLDGFLNLQERVGQEEAKELAIKRGLRDIEKREKRNATPQEMDALRTSAETSEEQEKIGALADHLDKSQVGQQYRGWAFVFLNSLVRFFSEAVNNSK